MRVRVRVRVRARALVCVSVCMCAYIYVFMCECVHVCLHLCVSVCMCGYIYVHVTYKLTRVYACGICARTRVAYTHTHAQLPHALLLPYIHRYIDTNI